MQASLERLRKRREEGHEGGFTLIELLIVIVILAILAAIVVFAVQNLTSQSAIASCQANYKTVETAAETFKAQVGVYPGGTLPAGVALSGAAATGASTADVNELLSTYTLANATTAGPWLKDVPFSGNHYQIQMNGTGDGVISVDSAGTTATATGTAVIPKGGTAATNTINDCTGVS